MKRTAYPTLCTSMYCGEVDCPATCSQLPELVAYYEARAAELRERMARAQAQGQEEVAE